MILNIVSGRPKIGTINVTTLPGATVTCALSPYTLSATASSSGTASFVVPKTGTWAITAKSGSSTKTGSVSVTTVGSTQSISLPFRKDLFMDGTQNVPWTFGQGTSLILNSIYMVAPSGGVSETRAYTTSPIDLTGYSTLNVQYESSTSSGDSSKQGFGYSSAATGTVTTTPFLGNQTKVTKTFDISSVTGAKYITLYESYQGYLTSLYVYQVYLT